MANLQTHDPVLELLYPEESTETQATEALRAGLSADALLELQDFQHIQGAFAALSVHDKPTAMTTQNILREGRLASAARVEKPRGFFSLLWNPAFGLAALLILLALPAVYLLHQSDPVDRGEDRSEVIATGVQPRGFELALKPAGVEPVAMAKNEEPPTPAMTAEVVEEEPSVDPGETLLAKADPVRDAQDKQGAPSSRPKKTTSRKGSSPRKTAAASVAQSNGNLQMDSGASPSNYNGADLFSQNDGNRVVLSPLELAIEIYHQGDNDQAVQRLDALMEGLSESDRVQAYYYRGMAHAALAFYYEATEDLEHIVKDHPDFEHYDKARYTYAQSLVEIGSTSDAALHFENLASSDSEFSAPAATALDGLNSVAPGGSGSNGSGAKAAKKKDKSASPSKRKAASMSEKEAAPLERSVRPDQPKNSGSLSID